MKSPLISRRMQSPDLLAVLLIGAVLVALAFAVAAAMPHAVDWRKAFRPATRLALRGHSPYDDPDFFNAPWTVIALAPFAILPEAIGRGGLFVAGFVTYGYTAYRLGGKPLDVGLFLASPVVLHGQLNGNIDWLALVGVIMPPHIGLFFLAIKPQVGIGVGVFWLWRAWQEGGARRVLHDFGPLVAVTLLSFVVFGPWPLRAEREIDLYWNASLFPWSIPIGLALLWYAVRLDSEKPALAAGPCFAPYVLFHSWVAALVPLAGHRRAMALAVAGLWILVLISALLS